MAFTLLRVLGAPSGALCKARGCLASWPGLIPFLSLSWLWSCRCRACSCRWSTSTGHCTKLLPGDCWTWYLCLTHSSQTWICSQLQIPSSSCSVSCMGVVGLDPAVDLTVGPHHALIPQAARLHFVCFFRQGLSLNLELRTLTRLARQQALRICLSSHSSWGYKCLPLCPAFTSVLGNLN